MEYLDEYKIEKLSIDEIKIYTLKMIKAFNIYLYEKSYLDNNIEKFDQGYIFLAAKTINENNIIGGICFDLNPNYFNQIYIDSLFVDRNYQANGIASNLLNYIVLNKDNLFNNRNINLYLFCREELQSFYEKEMFILDEKYENIKTIKMVRKI